jgi:parallel beta-helix repeat protein
VDANGDGIGDAPYVIDVDNQDRYPLMHPWSPLPVHNINTGLGYATIQEAINANETHDGHTIFVEAGTYYENVVVNKAVVLKGESSQLTIIDGRKLGAVVYITADNVTITEFTLQNSSAYPPRAGVYIYGSSGNMISNNNFVTNYMGIYLSSSRCNTISSNNITNNYGPIYLYGSNDSLVSHNKIANNDAGVELYCSFNNIVTNNIITRNRFWGLSLDLSDDNLISNNNLTDNRDGIFQYRSTSTITNNDIMNNGYGIYLSACFGNLIYHNSFINNVVQGGTTDSYNNVWDDGFPSGGNFWSDYTGVDVKSGSGQDLPGSDGIGDIPYIIDADNRDRYPLMSPYGAPPPPTYTLTITATVGGTTDPALGTYSYTVNSIVQVTAIPAANYLFDYWELNGVNVGSANPYSVLMDENHKLKAVFSPIQPPLSASISPLSASILAGQSVTFTSTVSGGYTPYTYQWYFNGNPVSGATSNTWTFTPTTGGIYYVHLKVTDAKANTAQSETARAEVAAVPVGGYSFPIQVQTKTEPTIPYIALMATLTAIFIKLKPKTKRKHR